MAEVSIAFITYTDEKGTLRENHFLAFGGLEETWNSDNNVIKFDVFASADEYARGRNQVIDTFKLPITHEQVLQLFAKEGNVGVEISEVVWELAITAPFIPDYSEIDVDRTEQIDGKKVNLIGSNQRVLKYKTVAELGNIVSVPLG